MSFSPRSIFRRSLRNDSIDHATNVVESRGPSSCSSSSQAPASRFGRSARRSGLLLGAATIAMVASACFPTGPVADWVPDLNGDGVISQSEIEARQKEIVENFVAAVEAQRRQLQLHPVLTCIRQHESDRGSYPHTNGYAAKNSRSTASGAYQFLNSTWRNVSKAAGFPGYSEARQAPWYVQDAVAKWVIDNQGRSAWRGSGC